RIGAVELLAEPSSIPDDLDAVATLERHLADGWDYSVEVVFDAPPEEVARWFPRSRGELGQEAGGGTRITATTGNAHWYAGQLACTPVPFRVVGGPELRDAVR